MFLKDWTINGLTLSKITTDNNKLWFVCSGTLTEHHSKDYTSDFSVFIEITPTKDTKIHEQIRDLVTPFATTAQIKGMVECLNNPEVAKLSRFENLYNSDGAVNRGYIRGMLKEAAGAALRDMREVCKINTDPFDTNVATRSVIGQDNLAEADA